MNISRERVNKIGTRKGVSNQNLPWTEKYRPKSLDEIIGNDDIISTLKRFVEERSIPHLFFSGPPGTGKTSTIQALAYDLYNRSYKELQENRLILESNASTLNRVSDIGTSGGKPGPIKNFIKAKVPLKEPFKILIMDEAERITEPAQHALRRLMELYHKTCRVCIICNQPGKIIEYLKSRCSTFKFRYLEGKEIKKRLKYIAESEKIDIEESSLDIILKSSKGDLRKAINIFQTIAIPDLGIINLELINKIQQEVKSDDIRRLIIFSLSGNFLKADDLLLELLKDNPIRVNLLKQISSEISNLEIENSIKIKLIDAVAKTDYIITQSKNVDLQFSSLLARFSILGEEYSKERFYL